MTPDLAKPAIDAARPKKHFAAFVSTLVLAAGLTLPRIAPAEPYQAAPHNDLDATIATMRANAEHWRRLAASPDANSVPSPLLATEFKDLNEFAATHKPAASVVMTDGFGWRVAYHVRDGSDSRVILLALMPNNRWRVTGDVKVTPPQGTSFIGSGKGARCSVNGTRIPQAFGFAHRTANASYKVKTRETPIFWTIDPKEHPVPLLNAEIECAASG